MTTRSQEAALVAAAQAGDESAFAAITEPYRRQLHVHCYRMLGSFEDAEDLVQETLLRAWRRRDSFEGRSLVRTWLYRIATNACLDALEHNSRRLLVPDVPPVGETYVEPPPTDLPWLQPYPDHLLDLVAPHESEPDVMVVSRETIELTYLAAIQYLPPKQRAILILRDALGWSANETGALLEMSLASVNSALQRARSTMRTRLPARGVDWKPATGPTDEERAVLQRYMEAVERSDDAALTALLREDARQTMPPSLAWSDGREAIGRLNAWFFGPDTPVPGDWRALATAANRQPAVAHYVRRRGDSKYRLYALDVLRIDGSAIIEITSFSAEVSPEIFPAFGLPPTL